MPIGRMTCSIGTSRSNPIMLSVAASCSVKKSKYLKKPRTTRLIATPQSSSSLRRAAKRSSAIPRRHRPVHQRGEDQQRDEAPVPRAVEDPAADQQQDLAPLVGRHRPDNREDDEEEDPEGQRRKQHGCLDPHDRGRAPVEIGLEPARDLEPAGAIEMDIVAAHQRLRALHPVPAPCRARPSAPASPNRPAPARPRPCAGSGGRSPMPAARTAAAAAAPGRRPAVVVRRGSEVAAVGASAAPPKRLPAPRIRAGCRARCRAARRSGSTSPAHRAAASGHRPTADAAGRSALRSVAS